MINEFAKISKDGRNVFGKYHGKTDYLKNLKLKDVSENILLYYSKQGNIFWTPGMFIAYFVDSKESFNKLKSGEYDILMFPIRTVYNAFTVNPIKDIWKKPKSLKGTEHILGILQGYYDEDKKTLLLDMASVRPGYKKNHIMSFLVKEVTGAFSAKKVFTSKRTDDGKKFFAKYDPKNKIGEDPKIREGINNMKQKEPKKMKLTKLLEDIDIFNPDQKPKNISEDQRNQVFEFIKNFNSNNEVVYREADLKKLARQLEVVGQLSEQILVNESEDWFDTVALKRDLKAINESIKVFSQTANEVAGLQQRLESAYEDIGLKLGKYFEINQMDDVDGHEINESKTVDVMRAVKILKKKFRNIKGIQPAEAWGGEKYEDAIHLGDAAEGGEIDGLPAADYYAKKTGVYENFGVHKKLENELNKLGYYSEWYDAGTLLAWPD